MAARSISRVNVAFDNTGSETPQRSRSSADNV
jgi:hypothetical protein